MPISIAGPEVPTVEPISAGSWRDGPAAGVAGPDLAPCPSCDPERFLATAVGRPEVTSPEAAAEVLVPALRGRDRERCVVALLDTKHRLLDVATVSIGSIDHTFMAPREVFRDALLANAAALVLGHNHPSGDPEPSRDDELVTRRLVRAGELVGIEVLDHLVVGGDRWVSLARRGVV
jgi:DNA repair protein RadC